MELFDALGLNVKILLAQLINFTVLLFVIYKFAYGPIMKVLDDRQEKIDDGIKNAEKAHEKLAEIEEKEKKVLHEARIEAQEIIKKSEEIAIKNAEEILAASREQAQRDLIQAKKQIENEKNKLLAEAKTEIVNMVIMATEKIIKEKMDSTKDNKLIEDIIK